MKIYTKTGDQGMTSLYGGDRVSKSDLRIETYGTVDELNAWLGLIADTCSIKKLTEDLREIQQKLFVIGAMLAVKNHSVFLPVKKISEKEISKIEKKIDFITTQLDQMTHFILPGGTPSASYAHIARCVCRRSERLCVQLGKENFVEQHIVIYLNRLSDYLFCVARLIVKEQGLEEIKWIPEK